MQTKRARTLSPPSTPCSTSKRRRFSSSFAYPYLPLSPSSQPYPDRPSDSPTNPFGRKRTAVVIGSLPRATSFGKHIPLRFQAILPRRKPGQDDIYRIVQVPLNYTFTHLKALITFLFGGVNSDPNLSTELSPGKSGGHLFEVYKEITRCEPEVSIGLIRKGRLWLRLSNERDPYLYKHDWEVDELEDEEEATTDTGDPNRHEVHWEAEEDVTLASIWDFEKSVTRGIIYHHCTRSGEHPISIHITPATRGAVSRKGRGNTPFVFSARGCADILVTEQPRGRQGRSTALPDDLTWELDVDRWNQPEDLFSMYFENMFASKRDVFDDDSDFGSSPIRSSSRSFTSTPGLTTDASSSSPISSNRTLATSSPNPYEHITSLSSPMALGLSIHEQYEAPAFTPAPGPANRKRLGYVSRRLNRSKRRSMHHVAQLENPNTEKEAEEEEVDELSSDREDGKAEKAEKDEPTVHNAAITPAPPVEPEKKERKLRKLNTIEANLQGILLERVSAIPTGIFSGTGTVDPNRIAVRIPKKKK